jgi:hypothetical protein
MAHTRALCAALLMLTATVHSASAITAEDVMKKMSHEQRVGYLAGLVDMLAYQAAANGDRAKGNCIADRFYREKREDSIARTLEVFSKFSDKRPEILLSVLANQLCKS